MGEEGQGLWYSAHVKEATVCQMSWLLTQTGPAVEEEEEVVVCPQLCSALLVVAPWGSWPCQQRAERVLQQQVVAYTEHL